MSTPVVIKVFVKSRGVIGSTRNLGSLFRRRPSQRLQTRTSPCRQQWWPCSRRRSAPPHGHARTRNCYGLSLTIVDFWNLERLQVNATYMHLPKLQYFTGVQLRPVGFHWE
uniref:Cupin_8 domain-containing protein n=1 Tax=Steinernema glaseri TaxID=37863 RepID=A0A1I7YKB9_9BILA